MSVSEMIYCRFCAEQKPTQEITDLAMTMDIRRAVIEKLSLFNAKWVDFTIKSLPETICDCCHYSLVTAYGFFTKIKISQAVLLNMAQNNSFKDEDETFDNYKISITCIKEEPSFIDSEIDDIFQKTENNNDNSEHDVPVELSLSPNDYVKGNEVDMSWDTYPWTCKHCNRNYESINELRSHSKKSHGRCCGFDCADCDASFDEFDEFIEHVRGHREGLKKVCQYCNMKLEDDRKHISIHVSRPQCNTCGELFRNKISLQRHLHKYQSLKQMKKMKSEQKISMFKDLFSYSVGLLETDKTLNTESWSNYPWICQYCEIKVSDLNSLRQHLKDTHAKCFGAKCVDCELLNGVCDFSTFFDHVRKHRPNLNFFCQHCNHKFQDHADRVIHISEHNVLKHKCNLCGECFPNSSNLRKHKTLYDPRKKQKPLTVEDLTCRICQKVAKRASNLIAHQKLHTDRQRDFFCDRCGKSFFTKGALTTHNLIHDNPEPQVCKICKKSFLTLTRLKKHVNTHYGEKPFECAECHKRFRLKEHLKGHMIIHTDLFPYTCKYCNKKFHFKNVLKNHEVIHTGARPYSCDVCNMDFTCWSNCNKHMMRKHGSTLAKSKMTPNGKVPINSKNCKLRKINLDEDTKEWTEQILVARKRGKKIGTEDKAD